MTKDYPGDSGTEQNKVMNTRAKLKCYEIAEFEGWGNIKQPDGTFKGGYVPNKRFKFQIVTGGSAENDHFYAVSGGTNLELVTNNSEVFGQFRVGGEYYADLSPAE
jgi:hypothetical protein